MITELTLKRPPPVRVATVPFLTKPPLMLTVPPLEFSVALLATLIAPVNVAGARGPRRSTGVGAANDQRAVVVVPRAVEGEVHAVAAAIQKAQSAAIGRCGRRSKGAVDIGLQDTVARCGPAREAVGVLQDPGASADFIDGTASVKDPARCNQRFGACCYFPPRGQSQRPYHFAR